jgi:hypothetical protein
VTGIPLMYALDVLGQTRGRDTVERATNRVGTSLGGLVIFRLDTKSENDLVDRSL